MVNGVRPAASSIPIEILRKLPEVVAQFTEEEVDVLGVSSDERHRTINFVGCPPPRRRDRTGATRNRSKEAPPHEIDVTDQLRSEFDRPKHPP